VISIKNAIGAYGGKQDLDDIPKKVGMISASKGRAASNRDLRRRQ
jgi:hypothetical protein